MTNTIPVLQVRESSVLIYHEPMFSRQFSNTRGARLRMKENRKGSYSGKMSNGARKRMCKAITLMCQSSKARWVYNPISKQYQYHRLSFITLTVSNSKNLTARQGYHLLLKHFLQWLRRTKDVTTYIWKAELQKRGQIHYHVTIPNFIDYREIRDKWNQLQKDAGLLDEFIEKFKHANPNSTDIHAVNHVKSMSNYLCKELTKSIDAKAVAVRKELEQTGLTGEALAHAVEERVNEELKTDGKIWDCSDTLAGRPYFTVVLSHDHQLQLEELERAGCRVVSGDWWKILYLNDKAPPDLLSGSQRSKFDAYMQSIAAGKNVDPAFTPTLPGAVIAYDLLQTENMNVEHSYTWEQLQLFLN